jgi:hypothetical protein
MSEVNLSTHAASSWVFWTAVVGFSMLTLERETHFRTHMAFSPTFFRWTSGRTSCDRLPRFHSFPKRGILTVLSRSALLPYKDGERNGFHQKNEGLFVLRMANHTMSPRWYDFGSIEVEKAEKVQTTIRLLLYHLRWILQGSCYFPDEPYIRWWECQN